MLRTIQLPYNFNRTGLRKEAEKMNSFLLLETVVDGMKVVSNQHRSLSQK
jgi:hypothetical protein